MAPNTTIDIKVIPGREATLLRFIDIYSDKMFRGSLLKDPKQCQQILKIILNCLPLKEKSKFRADEEAREERRERGRKLVPLVFNYMKENGIAFDNMHRIENFLPWITQYRWFKTEFTRETEFKFAVIKSIHHFLLRTKGYNIDEFEKNIHDREVKMVTRKIAELLNLLEPINSKSQIKDQLNYAIKKSKKMDIYEKHLFYKKELNTIYDYDFYDSFDFPV